MEKDIQFCQENHKKILLSMGGATPEYGLKSTQEGERLADELWNTFGGGHGFDRPFGLATVDGFDLDIENGANQGYPAFVKRMREHYATDKSKEYYIAAAPQCPFPDFFLGDTLDQSWFDFVMVQFYNNYCNVINGEQFNYQIWHDWAQKTSINKDVRLFVGIPGSPSAAGRGYVPFEQLTKTIAPLQTLSSFGGVMVWDVSQAYGNQQDVLPSYAHGISRLIHG
ncbi:glycoside hydrolase superfamily [Sporodiniella umbellata]|nr:glycoside hydrolase superfamily [Sporodiniella umbellata]